MRSGELVGILNVTPDSFSDGGEFFDPQKAIDHAYKLFEQGAAFIDIGAESTNPKSKPMEAHEEIKRLRLVLPAIHDAFGDRFSIDTYHPETIAWAQGLEMKPIINDVSGLHHPDMQHLAVNSRLVIVSHLPKDANGIPTRAHTGANFIDSLEQVVDELMATISYLGSIGLSESQIILDPGIGFGKTPRLNWCLLQFAKYVPHYPVMIGASNKRFLHTNPTTGEAIPELMAMRTRAQAEDATDEDKAAYKAKIDPINLHAGSIAMKSGAKYLRVHDVAAHITLFQ